ncbi:MAG: DUF535 family protein [Burkholderiaceae bacterium]
MNPTQHPEFFSDWGQLTMSPEPARRIPTLAKGPDAALIMRAAQRLYPELSLSSIKSRLRFMLAWWAHRGPLDAFCRKPENARLMCELWTRPETLGFLVWPYIHAGWDAIKRFEALSQHKQSMYSDMSGAAVPPLNSLIVADLSETSPGLKLVIDRAPWCLREGSLVFSQFLHDERMMSLAFSFGLQDGERVVYVGSVQGSNVDSALAKYREIAKDLQGMRSRDFLIKAFQLFTFHMGVKRVLCISEASRHHRHPYFGQSKAESLHLNYDEIWQEHAGVATDDGFFQLGSLPVIRPMEDIAAKNRPLYRRRYALMEKLSADIASRFGSAVEVAAPELQSRA